MYEFTHGGAWFKWSLLDRASKRLAAASFAMTLVATVPAALMFGERAHEWGYRLGYAANGGVGEPPVRDHSLVVAAQPWMALVVLVAGTAAGVFWWRFSLRQDELFNRIQNWALGMMGGWTVAVGCCWYALGSAGVIPLPSAFGLLAVSALLLYVFWFAAVKRWA